LNKKSVPAKVNSVINYLQSSWNELEEERKFLIERFTQLEVDLKNQKTQSFCREQQLGEVIKNRDEIIRRKDQEISEIQLYHENQINAIRQEQNNVNYQSMGLLKEKDEIITSLMMDKQSIA
jgi:hypothetical protein